ncbi:hypothetical protein Rsub_12738 [Raphidocelis subcapitata]|uniref:Cyclic nucleotide-binding domain-containing protein n=1 Tax=Raphidocelis subcapitata TaxID=307507 RepID=A0A2V0PK78_9CHLO|nr:hypothetical protein Rsub_12738 [Raphidocelis subcapitata]|eukprot:GBG00127.1 hypothetical protein Rsub_12738 [Raphidocelis subcapitata]
MAAAAAPREEQPEDARRPLALPPEKHAAFTGKLLAIASREEGARTAADLYFLRDRLHERCAFFRLWPPQLQAPVLCRLAAARTWVANEVIIGQGSRPGRFYIVVEGSCAVCVREAAAAARGGGGGGVGPSPRQGTSSVDGGGGGGDGGGGRGGGSSGGDGGRGGSRSDRKSSCDSGGCGASALRELAVLGPGDTFGEAALLGIARSPAFVVVRSARASTLSFDAARLAAAITAQSGGAPDPAAAAAAAAAAVAMAASAGGRARSGAWPGQRPRARWSAASR